MKAGLLNYAAASLPLPLLRAIPGKAYVYALDLETEVEIWLFCGAAEVTAMKPTELIRTR